MANQLYRQENTVVLVQGNKVTDFPIVDSYFYYDEVPQSYTIKSVQSRKTASIPRADIGTYKNELDVAYTEQSLLSFLRFYCSLTDKIPASNPMVVLPSGTYTPKNSISGAFDLLWESQTGNVTTSDGSIEKISGGGSWNGSAVCKVEHNGDFQLNFQIPDTSIDTMFGCDYFKASNGFEQIDFAIYKESSNNAIVYLNGTNSFALGPVSPTDVFTIERSDLSIIFKINGTSLYTRSILNNGFFNIDCSINSICSVTNIELVIP